MLKKYKSEESINIDDMKNYILDYIGKYHGQGNILALSGGWGGGKTFFWQKHIAPEIMKLLDPRVRGIFIAPSLIVLHEV